MIYDMIYDICQLFLLNLTEGVQKHAEHIMIRLIQSSDSIQSISSSSSIHSCVSSTARSAAPHRGQAEDARRQTAPHSEHSYSSGSNKLVKIR